MKKLFKHIILWLYYKYYFKEETQANDFLIYYLPGVVKEQPAGTYVVAKLNKDTTSWEPIYDSVKYPKDFKL